MGYSLRSGFAESQDSSNSPSYVSTVTMQLTMPYRRMNGLSSVHLEEIKIRDPALVATLPFDQDPLPRYATERILLRTLQRWSWFADARKRNPSLGTLSHLPPEVRSLIWRALLDYKGPSLSADGIWEYERDLGTPFHLSAYYFGFGRRRPASDTESAIGLRLTSSATKFAFEGKHTAEPLLLLPEPTNASAHSRWSLYKAMLTPQFAQIPYYRRALFDSTIRRI